jgi:hypothetical protein
MLLKIGSATNQRYNDDHDVNILESSQSKYNDGNGRMICYGGFLNNLSK